MEKMDIPAANHHVGSTERAFVAHVNDLNDFYLHSESIRNSLLKLGQDLYNEYSESFTKPLGINETLNVGDYCACPSESEDWYRGLIRQLDSNGHATVFKIDYGDVQCIPIQFLRPLQKRFFQLHRLAFHCSLANLIKPIDGWPLEVIEEFRSRLTTTFLYARSINYNEIRDISEVEITEKSSKTPLNKDFEQYQIQRSTLHMNDKLVYKYIPMEILDSTHPNQICILYYISPSCFYVYLREKINSHTSFQIDLQKAIQNLHPISSPKIYQPIAAQDIYAVWHRAIILDINSDPSKLSVYFIDIGQREYIPINNIRPLPEEFQRKPAFAIACCLYNVCPLNGNEQLIWKSNDQVHDEFNRLTANNVTCQVRAKQDQLCYDIEIDIPKIGDLGSFLFDKKLVSRTTMRGSQRPAFSSGQSPAQSYVRTQLIASGITPSRQQPQRLTQPSEYYNNSNNMAQQQQQTRLANTGLHNPTIQQSTNIPTTSSSSAISVVSPQEGYYTIIQVRSAAEFYGLSQNREADLNTLSKHLADYYNNAPNDSSLNVSFLMEGVLCVIQEGDKYHRVMIKHRESESRVSVKLVDRGDEIIVDTSELLQLDNRFSTVPAFAQPFRLRDYDEPQSSASTTLLLKKLILNQRVYIGQYGPPINGFYPVEVTLNNGQSVNKTLLSNDKNLSVTSPPISNNRPSFNQPQPAHITSQVFSNSTRHHSTIGQDLGGRLDVGQRRNDVLPAPQKILTGATRSQPGRFGGAPNQIPSSNEQIPRFSAVSDRNQQPQSQPVDSTPSKPMWNKDQNDRPGFTGSGVANQQTFGRQQTGSSQFSTNQRIDDNKTSITNNQNRFASNTSDNQQSSFEQKRPSGGGYSQDDRNERQTGGNNFQQNNYGTNENGSRRSDFSNRTGTDGFGDRGGTSGFAARGGGTGGYSDRGARGGFNDRNTGRNNEDSSQSFGGFSKRTEPFADRGGRSGNFQDRNGTNRNQGDDQNENSMQRSQNFNSNRGGFRGGRGGFQNRRDQGESGDFGGRGGFQNRRDQGEGGDFGGRGGFQNRRDQGENGDFGRRGGRGSSRGGGFNDGRGGYRNRDEIDLKLSSDNNNSSKTFSGWPNKQSTPTNFEAGDRFIESQMPAEGFKFVVSQVETANDFFIQLVSKGDELSSLSETLQTEYKQSPQINLSSLEINQPCLAKSPDDCWYRAIVLSTGVSKFKVRFIDFGDTTDVDSNTIRKIAKKHCSTAPYAYRCTFKNAQVVENVNTESVIDKCAQKEFHGKIETKISDGKFILHSDDLFNALLEINAIKIKSEITLKRIKCLIGYIESEQQKFYLQDDEETLGKIAELIANEEPNAPTLSLDEVKQLEPNTIIIASYLDEPYRGIIEKSNESDENIDIYFIDYGNTNPCPKTSLKRSSEQLNSYPYQAKHCHLYGVSSNEITNALKYLEDNSDTLEIEIINEKDQIYNVLVYNNNQCINEKFGYNPNNDQSSTIIKEQEQLSSEPEQQINDDVLLPNENLLDTSTMIKLETEDISPKYRRAFLTHVEKNKPYVYLQLIPESEPILDQINELIKNITEKDKHDSSYEIGDHIIAKFTEDDNYYRARIESYSSSSQLYTVYFLDYGNIDENVPIDHLYSYSNDLKQIEPLAHGYLLDKINSEIWNDHVRLLAEENINDFIEFYISDENNSMIHVKFANGIDIYNSKETIEQIKSPTIEENKTFTANISATDNDCFYIHILSDGNLHASEIEEILKTSEKEHKDSWLINDLCIVSNEENQYYRGQILAIDDNKYDVKCIDYGNTLQNISDNHLYVLSNEEIFKQPSLAYQCRLHGVDDIDQRKAIEEVIKHIPSNERVTITVENDRNDPCLFVILARENNDIVNDRYLSDNTDIIENENKQESDNDVNNEIILPNSSVPDEQLTSQTENTNHSNDPENVTENKNQSNDPENVTENTNQSNDPDNVTENKNQSNDPENVTENNSLLSITNNQTIDFGENDPSTTIKDETNNSISSN